MKISEYVSLIKNKPIKIHIKSSVFEDDLEINKSRTLLVRAFLVKLGISHNRIKIDFEKEFNDINKDEIAISLLKSKMKIFEKYILRMFLCSGFLVLLSIYFLEKFSRFYTNVTLSSFIVFVLILGIILLFETVFILQP